MPVPQTYVVAQGDSLSLISKKLYGDFSMVDELARVNSITNANLIYPGQQLVIPVKPGTSDGSAAASSSSSTTVTNTTNTSSTEVKKTIGKYVGWGFGFLALLLLGYEAIKQNKKNKGVKKKALAGSDDVDQIVTYIKYDDQLKAKKMTPATIDEAIRKFNREFPGEKLTLTKEDKATAIQQLA